MHEQLSQLVQGVCTTQAVSYRDGQASATVFVNDCQQTKHSGITRTRMHEVIGPHMVPVSRT
jgi:hypothetical protein